MWFGVKCARRLACLLRRAGKGAELSGQLSAGWKEDGVNVDATLYPPPLRLSWEHASGWIRAALQPLHHMCCR